MLTGGLSWALYPQQYLDEYYPKYNPGLWLTMCSICGGSFGVFAGGFLSDIAVKKMGMHSRFNRIFRHFNKNSRLI